MPLFKPVILVMALFLLVGCNNRHLRTESSSQTDVFGIQLYTAIDYQEIRGVRATEEPCL